MQYKKIRIGKSVIHQKYGKGVVKGFGKSLLIQVSFKSGVKSVAAYTLKPAKLFGLVWV